MSAEKVLKQAKKIKQASKSSKPLLERQRRARINSSLNELKHLVLSSLYQGCPEAEKNGEKMEKAEILELTVNFLKLVKSRRHYGLRPAEMNIPKYTASNHEYYARVEPRCNDAILIPSSVQPAISPCSMAGPTTTVDSSVCCTVQPCLGYQISSSLPPNAQLAKVPSRFQQTSSLQSSTVPFLHTRQPSKVQVWRPW